MINNKNKLPSYDELKQIPGIALLQKTTYQSTKVNRKATLTETNLNL